MKVTSWRRMHVERRGRDGREVACQATDGDPAARARTEPTPPTRRRLGSRSTRLPLVERGRHYCRASVRFPAAVATFDDKELEYLRSQRLARLATVDAKGAPHVVPVGFRVSDDADAIEVGGHNFAASKKYRDMKANPRVAIVIDDLASVDPWTPRGLEVRGTAELQDSAGGERFPPGFDEAWVRIVPARVVSWGIQAPPFTEGSFSARSVGRS